jgi:hypothetical protein
MTRPRESEPENQANENQNTSRKSQTMKPIKLLAVATAAVGLLTAANAQTTVYIAGAPALRTELTTAIENLVRGQAVERTFNGSAIITANVIRWRNATIGGQGNVTIQINYNGSAAGWKTNAARQQVRFIPDSQAAGSGATDVLTDLTAPATLAVPDFHISNEFQASTPWRGRNTVSFPENGFTTYQTLTDTIVGILPLRLVASPAAPAGLSITPALAQKLYKNGNLTLSELTGNTTDSNKRVYALSRGIDSGIRTLWAAANGVGTTTPIKTWQATTSNTTNKPVVGVTVVAPGVGYTSAPAVTIAAPGGNGTQATATATVANGKITSITVTNPGSGYNSAPTVTISGGNGSLASARAVIQGGTVTAHSLWAATGRTLGANGTDNRLLGVATPEGNGGYPTFGPLLTAITSTLNLPGGNPGDIYFTVLGESDADSAIKGGAKEVKWKNVQLGTLGTYGNNGTVTATSKPNPSTVGSATLTLANGQYDLWGYVRLPFANAALPVNSAKRRVHTAIADQLRNFDSPVKLRDVNVLRNQDGGKLVNGRRRL